MTTQINTNKGNKPRIRLLDFLRNPNVVQTVKLIVIIVLLLVALANRDIDFIIATLAGII